MPLIDITHSDLTGQNIAIPQGFTVTPGADDLNKGQDAAARPSWGDLFGSAFRQDNTLGSSIASQEWGVPLGKEQGFNAWESIKGTKYEKRYESFVDVQNTPALDARKRQIDQEEDDRKTLAAAPWYQSLPAQMVAGTVDFPTLLPGGAFVRSAKGGLSVAKSAVSVAVAGGVSTAVQEAILQDVQVTRSGAESAVNIGGSVLLSGLFGGVGAAVLGDVAWSRAVKTLDDELFGSTAVSTSVPISAGAAASMPASLDANTIAGRAASAIGQTSAPLNPILRALNSESPAWREISTQMMENSVYLKKNFEGIASQPAAETLMQEWNAGLVKAIRSTNDSFAEYRKGGGQLGRDEFRQAVGRAMRRNDLDENPVIAKVAQAWRASVFDPLKDAAIGAKLLPEDVAVETAPSYFSRMWNRGILLAREGEFKQIVRDWIDREAPKWAQEFDKVTAEKAAKLKGDELVEWQAERRLDREAKFSDMKEFAREIADEVFDTLTGKAGEGVRPEFVTVKSRGPLKERTFNIPDRLVEDFLEHDVEIVGRRYTRVMGADVELANKFGSPDMKEQVAKVREDYKRLRNGVSDEKALMKLANAEKRDIGDLEAIRDILRGTRNDGAADQSYAKFSRIANSFNYIRSMGEVVLASLPDIIRPAMVHGLSQYLHDVPKFATNLKAVKMSIGEAQLAGNVAETVLGSRLATLSEVIDPYSSRGPVEAFMQNATNLASKWNGIRIWTDAMKSIASVMTQNRILGNVEGFSRINKRERSYLAYLGIDESMAGRIAHQFAEHGETIDGVRVANTENWTDPVARRTYRAAMNKDVDSIIVEKNVGDVPLFSHTPTGRMLLQFKSFALASHQKVLLRGLQEDHVRFVGGTIGMTMIGMFITYMKGITGNRPEVQERAVKNPGWWVGEGLDRSGIFAIPMEIANSFEKFTGVNVIKDPVKAFDDGNAMSQRIQNRNDISTLLGPSVGAGQDMITVAGIPKRLWSGEEVSQGQKNAAQRLLPFNSYAGIRQMLSYFINPREQ